MENKTKKAIVTGGSGYLGSHLSKQLKKEGWFVVNYDKKFPQHTYWDETIVGDILDYDLLNGTFEVNDFDFVFHLAGRIEVSCGEQESTEFWKVNVGGTTNVLDTAKKNGVKNIIFSSTAGVYLSGLIPLNEEECTTNNHVYGNTKLACEQAIEDSGLNYIIFRYFNLAGADEEGDIGENHDPETHLIPAILQNLNNFQVNGNDFRTPDGTCIRDFVHVSDVVDAHLKAVNYLELGGQSMLINLGTGVGHSIMEVIKKVEKVTGTSVKFTINKRRSGDPDSLVADISLAKKVINYEPKHSIESIIRTANSWNEKNQRRG